MKNEHALVLYLDLCRLKQAHSMVRLVTLRRPSRREEGFASILFVSTLNNWPTYLIFLFFFWDFEIAFIPAQIPSLIEDCFFFFISFSRTILFPVKMMLDLKLHFFSSFSCIRTSFYLHLCGSPLFSLLFFWVAT